MKTRFHPSSASTRRPMRWAWCAKALAACAFTAWTLHAPNAAAAGNQQCYASGMKAETNWNIMNNFAGIQNGVSIADITFSQTIYASNTLINYSFGATVLTPGATNATKTIPLATFPGLGLRWSWAGYENVLDAPINTSALLPVGTVVTSSAFNWITAPFTSNVPSKEFKLKWKFELVVIDVKAYAGGVGDFSREPSLAGMQVLPIIRDNVPTITNQSCSPTLSGFAQALSAGGVIALPELPKPPTPTCQFPIATLNQSVPLNEASAGAIPSSSAPRTAGASNETRFQINAINCGANTNYAIYFTDAGAAGATKDFLSTTGALAGKVNLRLFQGANSVPVQFGPAPNGSVLPSYPAAVTNSLTPANSNFVHDFYAQYVRAPGVDASGVAPGTLAAQATVTVVYP